MPKADISVVIPVYNRPLEVIRALKSVLAQSILPQEIIVVDDGSRVPVDRAALEAMDPLIRVVTQDNLGGSAARNHGISIAKCEWVAFLDSDDEWLPKKLEAQLALTDAHPDYIGVFTGSQGVTANGELGEIFLPRESIRLFDLQKANVLTTTSSAMIRRDALNQVNGFDGSLPSCQDWDLWIRLRRIGTLGVVQDSLVYFHDGATDRITKNRMKVLKGHEITFRNIRAQVTDKSELRQIQSHHHIRLAEIYFRDFNEPRRAYGHALRAFFNHFSLSSAKWLVLIPAELVGIPTGALRRRRKRNT